MNIKFNQLWFGAVKLAMFCCCLSSLFAPQCLAFGPPPVITVQPLDQAVPKGSTVTLTVEATSSTTLSYQWNYKVLLFNIPILGATNNTLAINNVSPLNSGAYNVSMINAGGTASSRDAQLTVTNNVPVAKNDAFTTPANVKITNGTVSHPVSQLFQFVSMAPNSRLASAAATISNPTSILDNDTDANGDTLLAVLVTSVAHGVLNLYTDGTFDYTPDTDYVGNDSFTYKAFDGVAYSTVATVNITVTALMNSALPPTATALGAADVTTAAATLNAAINPQGSTASYYFQYGTTTNYGLASAPMSLPADTNTANVSTRVNGLVLGTDYHYSVVVSGPGGLTVGDDMFFSTPRFDTTALTVRTNGYGGISPQLDGSQLVIGQSYALTATPASGVTFVNWKDANGAIVSASAVLTFVMASNLSFTASFVDATKPTLSITNLATNCTVSNQLITVYGNASDNLSVANVFYNLNNSGWTAAATGNNWTNWSAVLNLMLGTNALSAYAVDFSGNLSATNTVRFTYVLVAPLTVRTNGAGSISPALNGALLRLGQSYTLTATNAAGYMFTNWTDAGGVIVTNRPALTFLMASNLSFTANFVDATKPTLSITNPAFSSTVSNQLVTVSGNAGDNVAVAGVFYSINNAGWLAAATASNWTNWSAALGLVVGSNSLSAYAVDLSGNRSATNTVRFTYVLVAPLTVRTNGAGSISPTLNGALLRLGQSYTLTATNAAGYMFTNWTDAGGVIVTNTPALTLLMASNLSFTANFVDVTKPVVTVTTPLATTSATNEFYPASGKTTDNVAVANVWYQLNGGGWYPATTTNNWTNWVATLDLTPGTNSLSAQAADTSGNLSAVVTVKFAYVTAPASLNGLKAAVTPDGLPAFDSAFGVSTFSQYSKYTNNSNGVGGYTYTRLTPNTGSLVVTYTAPPTTTNAGAQAFQLGFTSPGVARFTSLADGSTGDMVFSPATNLVPASLLNRSMVFVGSQGQGQSNLYTATNYVSTDLLARWTNRGTSFTYAAYSPLGALLKQTDTNGMTYIVTSFSGTNFGATYSESYNPAGSPAGSDLGFFGLVSQRAGGNAPTNLFNRSLSFESVGSRFKLSLGTNTFAEYSPTPAYSTGVGSYIYARTSTNAGNLTLNYIAPSDVSGSTNAAKLMFFAHNLAVFTNADQTVGSAVLGYTANLAPATLASKTIYATNNVTGNLNQLAFAADNTFSITGYLNDTGTYTFATYSQESGLAQLSFTGGDLAGDTGSLQLDYATAFTGKYVLSIFDSSNILVGTSRGVFGQP